MVQSLRKFHVFGLRKPRSRPLRAAWLQLHDIDVDCRGIAKAPLSRRIVANREFLVSDEGDRLRMIDTGLLLLPVGAEGLHHEGAVRTPKELLFIAAHLSERRLCCLPAEN